MEKAFGEKTEDLLVMEERVLAGVSEGAGRWNASRTQREIWVDKGELQVFIGGNDFYGLVSFVVFCHSGGR